MKFLYVKVPVMSHVQDGTRQLEEKIDQLLTETREGSVAGWGDSLGAALPDGSRPVAFIRIDVDVFNLASARTLLRKSLPAIGAAMGTEIHYKIDTRHFKDIYLNPDWLVDQPS